MLNNTCHPISIFTVTPPPCQLRPFSLPARIVTMVPNCSLSLFSSPVTDVFGKINLLNSLGCMLCLLKKSVISTNHGLFPWNCFLGSTNGIADYFTLPCLLSLLYISLHYSKMASILFPEYLKAVHGHCCYSLNSIPFFKRFHPLPHS